jgi:hypothetical protein
VSVYLRKPERKLANGELRYANPCRELAEERKVASKTKAELEAELKALRGARRSEGFVSIANNAIRWGGLVLIARYAFLSIETLAGQTTNANFLLNFLGNVEISVALSWLAMAGAVMYGVWQRHLRRDTVERLQKRNHQLEKLIDDRRSSSRLTERGDTRPEDAA